MIPSEIEAIKADFGVNSRRLLALYNDNIGCPLSSELEDAAQKADAAYEALKRLDMAMERSAV